MRWAIFSYLLPKFKSITPTNKKHEYKRYVGLKLIKRHTTNKIKKKIASKMLKTFVMFFEIFSPKNLFPRHTKILPPSSG